jgi:hypothetical protein
MWEFLRALGSAVLIEVLKLLVPAIFEDIAAIIRKVFATAISLF